MTNEALREANLGHLTVDHRSYARRGLTKVPEEHHGPKVWWRLRKIKEQQEALEAEEKAIEGKGSLTHASVCNATREIHRWIRDRKGGGDPLKSCTYLKFRPGAGLSFKADFDAAIDKERLRLEKLKKSKAGLSLGQDALLNDLMELLLAMVSARELTIGDGYGTERGSPGPEKR